MKDKKWGFWFLIVFVVGNMVGGGVFMFFFNLVNVLSLVGLIFVWIVIGFGVFMIVFVFGNLVMRKFELKGGF